MTSSWLQALQRLIPEEADRHAFHAIALSPALPYPRNVKFLIFADDEPEPSWILRCHRDAATAARERLVLDEMRIRGYRVQPELVGFDSFEDLHAQLLRFCRGRHGSLERWRSSAALLKLSSELARVQMDLAAWAQVKFDPRPLQTAVLLDSAHRARGLIGNVTQLVRTLEEARECLAGANAPALPQHGDCCIGNVLWDGAEIRILDWENFGLAFEPFVDVWLFALSLCEESGDPEAVSLFGRGANATAAETVVRLYASSVGLKADIGRQVFPLAVARFMQFNAAAGRMGVARRMCRILNAYLAESPSFMSALRS